MERTEQAKGLICAYINQITSNVSRYSSNLRRLISRFEPLKITNTQFLALVISRSLFTPMLK